MSKNRIKLNEAQLRNIIRNTILEGVYTGTDILPQGYDDEVEQGMDRAQWDNDPEWGPYDKAYQTLVQMNNSDHYKKLDTESDWDDFDSIRDYYDDAKEMELDDLENKNIYESQNSKNRIGLTESQLHRVIKESVENMLSEINRGWGGSSYHENYDEPIQRKFDNQTLKTIIQFMRNTIKSNDVRPLIEELYRLSEPKKMWKSRNEI